jgi:hypothetical protein
MDITLIAGTVLNLVWRQFSPILTILLKRFRKYGGFEGVQKLELVISKRA